MHIFKVIGIQKIIKLINHTFSSQMGISDSLAPHPLLTKLTLPTKKYTTISHIYTHTRSLTQINTQTHYMYFQPVFTLKSIVFKSCLTGRQHSTKFQHILNKIMYECVSKEKWLYRKFPKFWFGRNYFIWIFSSYWDCISHQISP